MMATQRLNPDQIDFDSAIAEMRNEKLSDDEIHKEIAAEFGSTIADQHLKRGVFAPKQESGIWPENWSRIPEQVPYEIPMAVAAAGLGFAAARTETAQKVLSNLKNRMFGPSAQPDMPGTGLNQAAVNQGAAPASTLASAPQTPAAEAAVVQAPTPEQIRLEKQRAAQAMIEGRPVIAGAGPVTQSIANSISPAQETFSPEKVPGVPTREQVPAHILPVDDISKKDVEILGNVESGKGKAKVSDVVKGAVAPKTAVAEPVAVEGRIPNYMQFKKKKSGALEYKNKQGSDVIGKGGWNWYQGQMGPEAEKSWLQTFGRTNQTTQDVQQAMKEGRLKGPEVVEGRGGSFKRETTVPEYIRGSAPVEAMARSGLAALGILPVAQKIKEGDYRGALNEAIPAMAMIAPALSLAASPLYTSEEEMKILKNAEQKRKVGAGRGIAPPSDYMR